MSASVSSRSVGEFLRKRKQGAQDFQPRRKTDVQWKATGVEQKPRGNKELNRGKYLSEHVVSARPFGISICMCVRVFCVTGLIVWSALMLYHVMSCVSYPLLSSARSYVDSCDSVSESVICVWCAVFVRAIFIRWRKIRTKRSRAREHEVTNLKKQIG